MRAAWNSNNDIAKVNQKDNIVGNNALIVASTLGLEQIVSLLIADNKIKINDQDKYGNTTLMKAINNNHQGVVT